MNMSGRTPLMNNNTRIRNKLKWIDMMLASAKTKVSRGTLLVHRGTAQWFTSSGTTVGNATV
jgi:hypothetical protein